MSNDLELLSEENLKKSYDELLNKFKILIENLDESKVQTKLIKTNLKKLIPNIEERCNPATALEISREIGYLANDKTKEELYRNLKHLHSHEL